MKYKILTVLLVITLTLGSFRINTKAEDGLNDLELVWYYHNHASYGVSQYTQISTNSGVWVNGYQGAITNEDNPMIISIINNQQETIKEFILEPNTYIIDHQVIDENNKVLRIFIGDLSSENQVYYKMYDNNVLIYYNIQFRYYTSGILKDYWDLGLDVGGYDLGYYLGSNYGYDEGYEDGVSTTYENGFGGIRNPFTDAFYKDEDSYSYGLGHQEGYEEGLGFDAFGWLKSIIYFIGWILNVQFIPGISLGRIAMLVLFIYLIPFIFRMFGGSD